MKEENMKSIDKATNKKEIDKKEKKYAIFCIYAKKTYTHLRNA